MEKSLYGERDYAYGQRMLTLRTTLGLTQAGLAAELGVSRRAVAQWEGGLGYPNVDHLKALITLAVQQQGFPAGREAEGIRELWKAAHQKVWLDEQWLATLLNLNPSPPLALFPIEQSQSADLVSGDPLDEIALWIVPYTRNPYFTGRDELLTYIEQQFSSQEPEQPTTLRQTALTQSQAIKGLGGIGKTQIAVEYAYRARERGRYRHTIWVSATSEEAILASFMVLIDRVPTLRAHSKMEQRTLIAASIHWLEQCLHPWLLIVDNADDLSLVHPYLPQHGNGSILLTTRASAVGSFAPSLEVDTMGIIEGTELLLRRAQRRIHASNEQINEASNLVVTLAQFPLALDQAGAYIEETGCSMQDYVQIYQQHRHTLLARRGKQTMQYPESVVTTWSLSFLYVEQTNPAAIELLQLCAFLSPDSIPEEVLTQGAPYWPHALQQAVGSLFTFNQMLEALLAFSLVKRHAEHHSLSIHRLVQVVQMERLSWQEQHQWAERLVRAVHAVFPRDPNVSWLQCQRYLEQVQVCDQLIQEHHLLLPEAAELLDRTGTYLRERGLYALAEPLYQRALSTREQLDDTEPLDIVHSLNHLAVLSYTQGQHAQTEALYQRALAIQEQHLGPEHPKVAATLTGLANLYREQGKHTQAMPLYQRALAIQEQHLGPEHLEVAATLTGLAFLHHEDGTYTRGEVLYLRALAIQEQHLGPEHLEVAATLTGLAYIYSRQGRYEEEEILYQRALAIQEQHLGPEHPKVAATLTGLANLYRDQGKYVQAEPLYQRALHQEESLGSEHPELARPLLGLALLSYKQGKYRQAERLHQRVLRILERILGTEHHILAHSLIGLADISQEQGKLAEAESLYQRALHIQQRQLGSNHPQVTVTLNGLANLYSEQGKLAEAESLYQQALYIQQQQLGSDHPQIPLTLNGLANLYSEQGKYREAEVFYQQALRLWEQQEHPDVSFALNGLANLYVKQGEYEKAEPLYQRALRIREQQVGLDHPETAKIMYHLARLLEAQDNDEEARTWYTRALTVREHMLGAQHPKTQDTRTRLTALLRKGELYEKGAQ